MIFLKHREIGEMKERKKYELSEKHLPLELTVEHYYQTEDLVEPMYWQQVIRSHRESRRWEILT